MRCGSWPPKVRVAHTRRAADPAAEVCSPRQPPGRGERGEHLSELLDEADEIRTLDQRATVVPPTTAVGVSNAAAQRARGGLRVSRRSRHAGTGPRDVGTRRESNPDERFYWEAVEMLATRSIAYDLASVCRQRVHSALA